jgi:acyl-CoA hydrolase
VLAALAAAGRRRLTFHAGMLGDGIVDAADAGILGDATPLGDPPLTTSILLGSHRLLLWASRDPRVRIVPSSRLHPAAVTSGIEGFCAVNFALQVDLVGNVGAETIGGRVVSGPGGALDFAVGACAAPGGRSIVALPSTTPKGASTIVPVLDGQTTTPGTRVHHVVTEHGVAELAGRSTDERAAALVAVAAPQHRDALRTALG